MEFFPAPFVAPSPAFAALVFPWQDSRVMLANISERGWCIPSGRVEQSETSEDAMRREAREEAGIELGEAIFIGCYRIGEAKEYRWADVFIAEVSDVLDWQPTDESLERLWVEKDDLPGQYYNWEPLVAAVFEHSWQQILNLRRQNC